MSSTMQRIGALNSLHSSVKQTTNIYIVECSVGNITTRRLADWHGPLLCAQCIGVYCSVDCCTDWQIGWEHCCVHTCPVLGAHFCPVQCDGERGTRQSGTSGAVRPESENLERGRDYKDIKKSQKPSHGNILETKRVIIDPLVSKQPEKN